MTRVLVVGYPASAGCPPEKTWRAAASILEQRLRGRFAGAIDFAYVDLFSREMAQHPEVEAMVASGIAIPPIVLIDGVLASSGGKLNLSAIERAVAGAFGASRATPEEVHP